jgi:8-oxo-dGTP diphosphatase
LDGHTTGGNNKQIKTYAFSENMDIIKSRMKVTAGIFRNGDKVLLMRRAADQPLAGEWEYPGGKFEDGEDGPTCLRRELFEELGIDAEIGDLITIAKHTTDSGKVIELHTYEITS